MLILLHFFVALGLTVRFSLFVGRISFSLYFFSFAILLLVFFNWFFLLILVLIWQQIVVKLPLSSSPPRILLPKLDAILQLPIISFLRLLPLVGRVLAAGGPGDVEHHIIVIHCCRQVYYNIDC